MRFFLLIDTSVIEERENFRTRVRLGNQSVRTPVWLPHLKDFDSVTIDFDHPIILTKLTFQLLMIAGLYDRCRLNNEDSFFYSASVITVSASSSINWLHHRMPVSMSFSLLYFCLFFQLFTVSLPVMGYFVAEMSQS